MSTVRFPSARLRAVEARSTQYRRTATASPSAWPSAAWCTITKPWARVVELRIAAPRIAFNVPNNLDVEESIPEDIRERLAAMGHQIRNRTLGNAHGLTIEYDANGKPVRFTGASDPRGTGLAKGY